MTDDHTVDVPERCEFCGVEMETGTIDFDEANQPRAELNPGPRPDARVIGWLAEQAEVAVTSVTVGEIYLGVRLLPRGKRREALLAAVESVLARHAGRVLAYDESAARIYARLQEARRAAGRALTVEDGMMAAIALRHDATLATRNVSDFDDLDLDLVNPWT